VALAVRVFIETACCPWQKVKMRESRRKSLWALTEESLSEHSVLTRGAMVDVVRTGSASVSLSTNGHVVGHRLVARASLQEPDSTQRIHVSAYTKHHQLNPTLTVCPMYASISCERFIGVPGGRSIFIFLKAQSHTDEHIYYSEIIRSL